MLTARVPGVPDSQAQIAAQWFVVSDLGLASISGNDGLHVFVRSLKTAQARAGVQVSLLSRANVVLATATTDAKGHVRFDPGLTHGTGGAEPAMITARASTGAGDDMSFLPLTDPEFDLSDRGVTGLPSAARSTCSWPPTAASIAPGETINATALARDHAGRGAGRAADDGGAGPARRGGG